MSGPRTDHVLTILAVSDLARSRAFYDAAFAWTIQVEVPVYVEYRLREGVGVGLYAREGFARNTGIAPASVPPGQRAPRVGFFRRNPRLLASTLLLVALGLAAGLGWVALQGSQVPLPAQPFDEVRFPTPATR